MARKNVLNYLVADGQSLSANFTTSPTLIKYLDNCSYQINVTTTNSTGTFEIQGSNDFQVSEVTDLDTDPGSWVTIPLDGATTGPIVAAASDTILIDMNQLPFNAIRVKYTATIAGTGTCDIILNSKQVGG